MTELLGFINGLFFVGFILMGGAIFYALMPRETVDFLRGIGELFGFRKEES